MKWLVLFIKRCIEEMATVSVETLLRIHVWLRCIKTAEKSDVIQTVLQQNAITKSTGNPHYTRGHYTRGPLMLVHCAPGKLSL